MRSLILRRVALAAVVPVVVGPLAACGGSGSSGTAADPQAPSSSATSTSTSARSNGAATAHTVDPRAFLAKVKAGAAKLTTARFTMNMDLSGQSIDARGALDLRGAQPAMQISMDLTGMGTPTQLRLVGGNLYIQDPTTGGQKFVKMSLSDPSGPLAGLGGTLDSYDPQSLISKLSPDTFRKVTDLGAQNIGGRQLEHYRVVASTKAAASLLKNAPSTVSLPRTISYDLWLDSDNRMARMSMLMKKVLKLTASYSDYGTDLHITAPPASQVESGSSSTL